MGSVHSTASSYLPACNNWLKRVICVEANAGGDRARSEMNKYPSPALHNYSVAKHKKYEPIRDIALNQKRGGSRPFAPTFYAGILSHQGEMSPDLISLIELFTAQYKTLCASLNLQDGVSKGKRAADFRCRFKDALMATNARGFGATLGAAGSPRFTPQPLELDGLVSALPAWEVSPYA